MIISDTESATACSELYHQGHGFANKMLFSWSPESHFLCLLNHLQHRIMSSFCQLLTLITLSVLVAGDDTERRRVLSQSPCAFPPYAGTTCSSSDPTDCPCAALSESERTAILDAHNYNRDLAASGNEDCSDNLGTGTTKCPAATDMNELVWDDSLEAIATYWAHQLSLLSDIVYISKMD